MRRVIQIGALTTGGLGFGGLLTAAWMFRLVQSPRTSPRADCEMAWAILSKPDIFLIGACALMGVAIGNLYLNRDGVARLETAVAPGRLMLAGLVGLIALIILVMTPAIFLLLVNVGAAGGAPCVSASFAHLVASLGFGIVTGALAGSRFNPLLAVVISLTFMGVLYVVGPSLFDKRLLNVGATPLPMMDRQRSWLFALSACAVLAILSLAALTYMASWRRRSSVIALGVLPALAFFIFPSPSPFIADRLEERSCTTVGTSHRFCVPQSYSWLLIASGPDVRRLLHSAARAGLDTSRIRPTLEVGQVETVSARDVSRSALTTAYITDDKVPPLELAGMLVTPSWCSSLRADVPPEGLLRQSGVLAVWLLVQGGYIRASDAVGMVPPDAPDPAGLSVGQVDEALVAMQSCGHAPWAG